MLVRVMSASWPPTMKARIKAKGIGSSLSPLGHYLLPINSLGLLWECRLVKPHPVQPPLTMPTLDSDNGFNI